MGKKLAGILFIRNGVLLDYCFEEAIKSLQAFCDIVIVVEAGSTDDTFEKIESIQDEKTIILRCNKEMWEEKKGREKLSYFTNIGIDYAERNGYEYIFNLQGDEVTHEDSFKYIKQAVNLSEEGYLISRINLWGSSKKMLNVPQNRKPVSTVICRLAKSNYRSYDDAESINCPASLDFINKIEIFHMGFVRDKTKHIEKIKEIQGNIFQMDVDKRAVESNEFKAWDWGFTKDDVIPIEKELPIFIKGWATKRDEVNEC